jgi:hypothetical protein
MMFIDGNSKAGFLAVIVLLMTQCVSIAEFTRRFQNRFDKFEGKYSLSKKINVSLSENKLILNFKDVKITSGERHVGRVHSAAVNRNGTSACLLIDINSEEGKGTYLFSHSTQDDGLKVRYLLEDALGDVIVADLYSVSTSGRYCLANVGVKRRRESGGFVVSYNLRIIDLKIGKVMDKVVDDWGEIIKR